MPGESHFLQSIRLRNILSFGPDTLELELRPLNVLIGPNGAGKSNLIDAISLLRAAPRNLLEPIQRGGGIQEWIWKGSRDPGPAEISVSVYQPNRAVALRHKLSFTMVGQRAELVDEAIENDAGRDPSHPDVYFYYRYQSGRPVLNVKSERQKSSKASKRELRREDLLIDQSVISQRKDPDQYPEITDLGNRYSRIAVFSDWNLGRGSQPRKPQPTDLPADFLQGDAVNLALVLNDLEHRANLRAGLVKRLQDADGSIVDFSTRVLGGTIQLFLHYNELQSPVPATRLSDGTFRYLCLLAILCHPDPPPLVCLEEPELGLHPDLLPKLADLLIDASQRMQLIVTTHSDTLVDALTNTPESVIVCGKEAGATTMRRLDSSGLQNWLSEYGLGQLWREGHIGGNRW